jgi:hypothetical protein
VEFLGDIETQTWIDLDKRQEQELEEWLQAELEVRGVVTAESGPRVGL